jgi:Bacterial Ig-like domain (group 3)/FG-GAP-like repeat
MNRLYFYVCAVLSLFALAMAATAQSRDSNSSVFRDPTKQFAPGATYSSSAEPWAICVGDFNGDGNIDVALAGIGSTGTNVAVTVALGTGNGQFTLEKDFTAASSSFRPTGIAAADLNHDGKVDLVVTYQGFRGGAVTILPGNGDGTFSTGATYDVGGAGVAMGDFNGDGIPDIASPRQTRTAVDILLGNGDGTFTAGTSLVPLKYGAWGDPLVADLNRDGKLDLVIQMYSPGGYNVALGNGDGTFQPAVFYSLPDSYTGVVVADFNQDGIPDVGFAGNYDYCDIPSHTLIVGVALGNGDGTFQAPIVSDDKNVCGGTFVVAADFNGDGKMDLLEASTQTLFLGEGAGILDAGDFSGGWAPYTFGAIAADFNGDGAPDLVVVDDANPGFDVSLNVSGDRETLTSSLNPSKVGKNVSFTATVTATVSRAAVAGSVMFRDGNTTLGTVILSSGIAAFTTSSLTAGTHTISAVYSGDHNYIPKTTKLVQTVQQ